MHPTKKDKNYDKGHVMERPMVIMLGAALGFFILSFVAMGLAPWTTLKSVAKPPATFKNPYVDEEGNINAAGRGRLIYQREACFHCHSQFVRPVAGEPFRYGPASQAWEHLYDLPQLYGTRRIGPDLSREAGRRTDDWHFAHLYNPRHVVPLSVMPSYPWMFETKDGAITPKQDAQDLVAYLQILGAPFKEDVENMAYPEKVRIVGDIATNDVISQKGQELFKNHCVGCHGARGDGESDANKFLSPHAVSLITRYMAPVEVYTVLNSGVRGTAMPSFHEMPQKELWALSVYVSEMGEEVLKEKATWAYTDEQSTKGKELYEAQCGTCHGNDGAAEGPAALALKPRPRAFKYRVMNFASFSTVMDEGRANTGMPPFPHLTPDERTALHAYVTSLFEEKAGAQ